MLIRIAIADGDDIGAAKVLLAPFALVLLAESLADHIGLPGPETLWLGSPTWAISGLVSDEIMARRYKEIDEQRSDDVRMLLQLISARSKWIEAAALQGLPTTRVEDVIGVGTELDIFEALPDRAGWLSGGNFRGVSRKRERKAKLGLIEMAATYVVNPFDPSIFIESAHGVEAVLRKDVMQFRLAP